MNIIVCIKQVPNTTNVQIDHETGRLKREGVESIINPFDEYAIEEGVNLKKARRKGCSCNNGAPQAEAALREAISRGADEAVLVSDRAFGGADTLATSYALSSAINNIGDYGVIFCGKQATDGDTAQVGPELRKCLISPCRLCEKLKTSMINNEVQRMMEDGYDVIETPLPAL